MEPLIECEEEMNCDSVAAIQNKPDSNQEYEKCEQDEQIQSNNKLQLANSGNSGGGNNSCGGGGNNNNNGGPIKSTKKYSNNISNYRQEYDELPVDPDERYNYFAQEYDNILHDIKSQNEVIGQFLRLLRAELKTSKDKNSLNNLKSVVESECSKVDGLVVKALRIQHMYPDEEWDAIPINQNKQDIIQLLSEEKKIKVSCQTTVRNSSSKTISRTSSTTSTTSNQSKRTLNYLAERSKENRNPKDLRSKDNSNSSKNNSYNSSKSNNTNNNNSNKVKTNTKKNNSGKENKGKVSDKYSELMDVLKSKENELQGMLDTIEKTFTTHLQKQPQNNLVGSDNNINQETHLKYLQRKVSVLQLEQKEFKKQIRFQQDEIDKYQRKFAEQKDAIDSLETNNKHMEHDISAIIVNLKEGYESKLKELSAFPRLLKLEKQKLEAVTRDKREIETKFKLLTKEFEHVKEKLEEKSKKVSTTSLERIRALKRELQVFKNFNSTLREERDRLATELHRSKSELDHVRVESNKLLFKTRDQAESQRRLYQKKINELQTELLTNRASNTCFVKQRNKVIDDIQSQLHNLKHNFEVSQSHIDNLNKHISSLSMANPFQTQSETYVK